VTEVVVSETAGAVPIFAGTAACSTWEAIALGEDAAVAGADAAILTPPFYFRIPDEMLYGHFADVAASGALPVVVYNNPLYTGINLSPALIASLMELDGVVGLKQSNDDLGQLVEALRLAEPSGRSLCTGIDSQFYAALCVGARGIFSTAAAIVPAQLVRLYDLVQEGDHDAALEQHRRLQPLNRFLEYDPGYVSPTKEALQMLGLDCGPVRRPLPDFPEGERAALKDALAGLGVLEREAVA
jgi:4-hydroxy-tetrahydrodipicolinate synthase